jgi:chaperonin GroES
VTASVNVDRLRPLQDKVIIRPDEAPGKTLGGIIIPEAYRGVRSKDDKGRRASWGTVLAVGPGATDVKGRHWPIEVYPGDRVLVNDIAPKETFQDDDGKPLYSVSSFAVVAFDEDVRATLKKDRL